MLDIKQIRENPQLVQERLNSRSGKYDIEPILQLDRQQRELEGTRSQLQARSNEIGKIVGQKIKSGINPQDPEIQTLRDEGNSVKATLSELEPQEKNLKAEIAQLVLALPNLPSDSTPIGKNEEDNVEVRRWGDEYIPQNPNILPHWEIGEKLGILIGWNIAIGVIIGKAHKAAQWKGADSIFGLLSLILKKNWAKTQRKTVNENTLRTGCNKMSQLVYQD